MKPIQAGDVCQVISGQGRSKSPNIGLTVKVGHRIYGDYGMDHTQFGPVHRCTGAGVMQLGDNGEYFSPGWADFPIAWLRKIDPVALSAQLEKAVTA